MIPVMMQTFGGGLFYVEGRAARQFGHSFRINPDQSTADTAVSPRHPGKFFSNSLDTNYFRAYCGGGNSYWPSASYNHRSLAVFKGKVYQALNQISPLGSELSLVRFDGSGLFINRGDSGYDDRPQLNGRGFELLSPSGGTADAQSLPMETRTHDLGLVVHNGVLFYVGAIFDKDDNPNDLWPQFAWDSDTTEQPASTSRLVRQYFWAWIDADDRKTFGPVTRFTEGFTTNAKNAEHLHTCDAISFSSDLYFCNVSDVIKINGGSGTMTLMDTDTVRPTTRSLEVWPSGGFSNGVAQGPSELLILEGSGILKKIRPTSQFPSGVDVYADLSDLTIAPGIGQTANRRSTDPWLGRMNGSTTDQPMRACKLIAFENQLHAFICTEASGVHHFINDGNKASGVSNWSDASASLPDDLVRFDGSLFATIDPVRSRLLVSYVTMGNLGLQGHPSNETAGGGTYLYSYKDGVWEEMFVGAAGGTPRGLVPLANLGPFTTIPSGVNPQVMRCSDYAIMTYTLTDQEARPVDVTVEYSLNKGVSWSTARRFRSYDTRVPLGSGVENLATSPNGIEYTFYWDYVNDVGFNRIEEALLRVTPILRV